MSTTPLHPRIHEVIAALEAAQRETDAMLATLTPADETRRLPDGWTVAQVVEHMAIVESGAGRVVGNIIKAVVDQRETSDEPIAPSVLRYKVADPTMRKVVAPEVVHPVHGASVAESAERMRVSRARLIEAFAAASGRALAQAHFPHPLFGPLDGYQWGHLAAQHQLRHLVQIRTILAS
jgi:hypothetical protein